MRLLPRRRRKEPKPVVIDMTKIATKNDITALEKNYQEARRQLGIALLTPRQRAKVEMILARRKADGKKEK